MATKDLSKEDCQVLKSLVNKELKLRVDWSVPHMRAYRQQLQDCVVKLEM